jgi:hypothetical protein
MTDRGGGYMSKSEVVKNIMKNIKEEYGDIDVSGIDPEDIANTVRTLKVLTELDNQYAMKCNELEETFTPKQQDAFYAFEVLIESLSPEQIKLLHEIIEFKAEMLKLDSKEINSLILEDNIIQEKTMVDSRCI